VIRYSVLRMPENRPHLAREMLYYNPRPLEGGYSSESVLGVFRNDVLRAQT
jgi:hypothetical protein